jgi:hypothetical protein
MGDGSAMGELDLHAASSQSSTWSKRQAVMRADSFIGAGNVSSFTFRQRVAAENGSIAMSCDWRRNLIVGGTSRGAIAARESIVLLVIRLFESGSDRDRRGKSQTRQLRYSAAPAHPFVPTGC